MKLRSTDQKLLALANFLVFAQLAAVLTFGGCWLKNVNAPKASTAPAATPRVILRTEKLPDATIPEATKSL